MKKTFLLLFVLGTFSLLVFAQEKHSQQVSKSSIEIEGVKLQLGMTKADVAERFVGTQVTKMNEDRWNIGKYGSVAFRGGKVVFADRSWIHAGDDEIDGIFAVVSSLNREGYIACKVLAEKKSVPVTDPTTGRELAALSGNFQRVWIACGPKTILILKARIGGHLSEDISEQLGYLDVP